MRRPVRAPARAKARGPPVAGPRRDPDTRLAGRHTKTPADEVKPRAVLPAGGTKEGDPLGRPRRHRAHVAGHQRDRVQRRRAGVGGPPRWLVRARGRPAPTVAAATGPEAGVRSSRCTLPPLPPTLKRALGAQAPPRGRVEGGSDGLRLRRSLCARAPKTRALLWAPAAKAHPLRHSCGGRGVSRLATLRSARAGRSARRNSNADIFFSHPVYERVAPLVAIFLF